MWMEGWTGVWNRPVRTKVPEVQVAGLSRVIRRLPAAPGTSSRSLSPGSATASGRRLSVASGGIPTESRSPRNRTRPEPCPALWSLAKPGAAAQVQSPTETDGEFTGHARSRAGPECRGGGVSRCGRWRPRRARRSPAGRSAPALFSTLSGGVWGPFFQSLVRKLGIRSPRTAFSAFSAVWSGPSTIPSLCFQ